MWDYFAKFRFRIVTLAVIVLNSLVNLLSLGGVTTAEVSDTYQTLLTPADFTFSIWGIIYTGLIIFSFWEDRTQSESANHSQTRKFKWYLIASVANVSWLFFWHYQFLVVTPIILAVQVYSLVKLYLEINQTGLSYSKQTFFSKLPIGIYLGWSSIALVSNIASVIWSHVMSISITTIPEPSSSRMLQSTEISIIAMITIAIFAIGAYFLVRKLEDPIIILPVGWGYLGILANYQDNDYLLQPEFTILLLAILTVFTLQTIRLLLRGYRQKLKT